MAAFTVLFSATTGECVCLEVQVAEMDNANRMARLYIHRTHVHHLKHNPRGEEHGTHNVQPTDTATRALQLFSHHCQQLQETEGFVRVQVTHPRGLGSSLLAQLCRTIDPVLPPDLANLVSVIYADAYAEVCTAGFSE